MTDIATHLSIPGGKLWKPLDGGRWPRGPEWFVVADDDVVRAKIAFTQQCIYWAGAGHYIDEIVWAVRTRDVRVIGQVEESFDSGRFVSQPETWVTFEGGDYLVQESVGCMVRAIPPLLMPLEFSELIRGRPGPRRSSPRTVAVHFGTAGNPYFRA